MASPLLVGKSTQTRNNGTGGIFRSFCGYRSGAYGLLIVMVFFEIVIRSLSWRYLKLRIAAA